MPAIAARKEIGESYMNVARLMRWAKVFSSGAVVYQAAGCTAPGGLLDSFFSSPILEVVQTVFLGITAAGGYAILQNI